MTTTEDDDYVPIEQTVEQGWHGYRSEALDGDAPEEQLSDMQHAFFGGAAWMFHKIYNLGRTEQLEGVDAMQALADELYVFGQTYGKDKTLM